MQSIKQVYPSSEIKLCLWHFFSNLEVNRNKIYGVIDNQTPETKNILKHVETPMLYWTKLYCGNFSIYRGWWKKMILKKKMCQLF